MADAYKIEIVAPASGGDTKKVPIAGNNNESKSVSSSESSSVKSGKKASSIAGYVAYKRYVAPFVRQGIQYSISTVGLRTGNMERQQRMQSAYDIGSQIFGIGESIALGFAVGGGVGAVVGAVMGTATTLIGVAQKQNTLKINNAIENQQISMLNARAGAINGNRR